MSITLCHFSKLGEVPREGNLREEAVRGAFVQMQMAMLNRYESSVMRVLGGRSDVKCDHVE